MCLFLILTSTLDCTIQFTTLKSFHHNDACIRSHKVRISQKKVNFKVARLTRKVLICFNFGTNFAHYFAGMGLKLQIILDIC